MKILLPLLLITGLLAAGCANSQEGTPVFGDPNTNNTGWSLVTDGESVWFTAEGSDWRNDPVELVKIDTATGDVDWQQEFGIGSSSSGLAIHDGVIWSQAYDSLPSDPAIEDQEVLFQIDAETGDIINQRAVSDLIFSTPVVLVDDTAWAYNHTQEKTEILIYDIETFDVLGSSDSSDWFTPTGDFSSPTQMLLLDDTVWMLDGRSLVGLDTATYENIDGVDTSHILLNKLEVHDGLLWVAESDNPEEGTFSYNPTTKKLTPSTLYESPIGNNYHNGYTYDMIDQTTIAQIDNKTGDQVATYTDLDPFSAVVTDGYLWALNKGQIFRYPTKP